MEVDSESFSRLRCILIEETRGVSDLLIWLALAASIVLDGRRPFNVHPLRVVNEVFECLRAWVAKSLMPHVCQRFSGFSSGIGVELITAGEEGAAREVLGNILKDELVVLVL